MSKPLTFSLMGVCLLVGMGIGFSLTPEYGQMRQENSLEMKSLGQADRYVDLRYIDNMIAHHYSAIHLAKQVQASSHHKEIRNLASEIIANDQAGIEKLYSWKKDWYQNERQISLFEKVNVGSVDDTQDLRFLNALITHHEAAIMLSQEIQTKSARNDILDLSSSVIVSLSDGLDTLKQWRKEWYGVS